MKKLKASGDENKIRYAKTLARCYGIFHNMGFILNPTEISLEEDKYGLNYLCYYLENFVDTAKISSIAFVMTALADDENLDPFCKYLMFTHLYSPEEIAEIDREELRREQEKIEKEIDYD